MKQLQWYEFWLLIISLQKSTTEYDVLFIQKQTLSQINSDELLYFYGGPDH